MKIFLKKKKKKKQQYARERYKNISEDEKQKLFEYRKKYFASLQGKYQKPFSFALMFEKNIGHF